MPRPSKRLDCSTGCSVEATLSLIDGKWKGVSSSSCCAEPCASTSSAACFPSSPSACSPTSCASWRQDGLVAAVYAQIRPGGVQPDRARPHLEPVLLALKAWGDAHAPITAQAETSADAA